MRILLGLGAMMLALTGIQAGEKRPFGLYPGHYKAVKEAITSGSAMEAVKRIDGDLTEVLMSGAPKQAQRLGELLCLRKAAEIFSKSKDKSMPQFLIDRPKLCSRFLHALDADDHHEAALRILKTLQDVAPDRFEKWFEFCIAYSVVWDRWRYHHWVRKKLEPDTMVRNYKFYLENKDWCIINPQHLPFELAVYVVSTRLTAAELQWVRKTYTKKDLANLNALYQSFPWTKKLSPAHGTGKGVDYTLPNIKKLGGVCMEQAYATENICRLFGLPATYTRGMGGRGGHAWLGALSLRPKVEWNMTYGRYRNDHYYKGIVNDPTHFGSSITDSIVKMSAALLKAGNVDKIEEGYTYLDAVNWANAHLPEKTKHPQFRTRQALVQDLLNRSLTASPYNGPAWMHLSKLAEAKNMDSKAGIHWMGKLFQYTATDFPDFTVSCAQKFMGCVDDAKWKAQILAKMYNIIKRKRPDLACDIKVAEGEVWLEQGDFQRAVMCFMYPLANFSKDAHILARAKDRMKAIEEKASKEKLAKAYQMIIQALSSVRKLDQSQREVRDMALDKLIPIYEERGDSRMVAALKKMVGK